MRDVVEVEYGYRGFRFFVLETTDRLRRVGDFYCPALELVGVKMIAEMFAAIDVAADARYAAWVKRKRK